MKEIECPNCGSLTPDDSRYCEMCGAELLQCVKCGALGTDPRCGDCGSPMVTRKFDAQPHTTANTEREPKIPHPRQVAESPQPGGNDAHQTSAGRALRLKYRNGSTTLLVKDQAIIGRSEGEYRELLADFDLISRRHGKFVRQGRQWYIIDLDSTNGCFVNDQEVRPNTPTPFQKGDMVDIGTYEFDVI